MTPLIRFSTMINISISVNNSKFTSFFLKKACHVNPDAEKNEQDRVHIFQYTCL